MIDGSERSDAVIDYLLELARRGTRLDVILLNVQPRPSAWQTRGFPENSPRERLGNYRGKRIVHSVGQRLGNAGIEAVERVEVGDEAATIVRCAVEIPADQIVLPAESAGLARRWLARHTGLTLSSVATEVSQNSPVPVVRLNRSIGARDVTHGSPNEGLSNAAHNAN